MDLTDIVPSAFIPKPLTVVVVGTGVSGIQFAHDVTASLKDVDLQIFDRNPCLGGTWYLNNYPGCTCDVPSHTYQFSWAPNPLWSSLYPPAREIHQYLEDVVDKHNLRRFMTFNTECVSANWDEKSSKWEIVFRNVQSTFERTIWADIFVYAVGRLNNYKVPRIPGQDKFQGKQVHTANWPSRMNVKKKRVIVIGNGASSVQCTAALQPVVSKVINIARGPTWIVPHVFSDDGAVQRHYSSEQKNALQLSPPKYYDFRIGLEKKLAAGFPGLWKGTRSQARFTSLSESFMKSKIADQKLLDALLPDFEAGCRRFTPGGPYLDALQQPNAEYLRDSISELTSEGLITSSGRNIECDIIVYATGFEPYQPRFPVIGRAGQSLSKAWDREGPCESYMAAMVAGFPNFFDKNANGKIIVPWPGTVLHYYAATEIIRWEDFDLEYENPAEKYASFGNGVTADGFVPDRFPWVIPPLQQKHPISLSSGSPEKPLLVQGRI
ncbi:uncharacterized protein N7496_002776 [Penicillium cataractarum]|uniref:FAD/NAD(P)-binding domain-containing protein n=1 Tax=Penicillium cataractarum TaxID=2100454 RepID=A0A9W9VFK1_9EURO|nr:uncharacterized protein N7496_002776 [Penicillium cataractarum]KAJ5380348.1 hypothetical protein N7496_002776 [Penicillium cataractarum]